MQASGRYTFRREEALAALGGSSVAFGSAAARLAAKRRIIAPRRGFFVVVPLEYRSAGAPPPSWYVDDLMAFHRQPYYVGLLSAAALHGAGHQAPQEFQVVTDRPLRPAVVGRARIRFFVKRGLEATPMTAVKTDTGSMRISTPEATAFDLVRYVAGAGHLNNVATVLSELAEVIDPLRLVDAARAGVEISVVRRLGFLLDHVGAREVTGPLAGWLGDGPARPIPLRPDRGFEGAPKNPTWQVIVNETIETDL